MKRCRFCGAEAGLIKAHVIPEAFFRPLREGGETPLIVAGAKGVLPKRAPIGVYDKELLCASCEARFSPIDSYGIDVLLAGFANHFAPIRNGSELVGYEGSSVDKARLLEFLISILWRASASSQPFYNTVDLGALEQAAKDSLFGSPSVVPPIFNAVLSIWSEAEDDRVPTTALMNPHREKWDGVNSYRLYLGKVVAYVKVDQQQFSDPLASLSLQANGPCVLVTRNLAGSNDIKAMRKTARTSEVNRQAFHAARKRT